MNVLVDTHILLWFLKGEKELPKRIIAILQNKDTNCFVSIASLWEIAIKTQLDKLNLGFPLPDLSQYLTDLDIEILPVTFNHIITLTQLENHHRDPFDRIIIAQAINENLALISKDENFDHYPIVNLFNT